MARVSRVGAGISSAFLWLFVALGGGPAAAEQPTCVTLCQQKVDVCAGQCEVVGDAAYRDPASLRQCQLACAKQLFVSCVERCSETGEVVENDYEFDPAKPEHPPTPPRGDR